MVMLVMKQGNLLKSKRGSMQSKNIWMHFKRLSPWPTLMQMSEWLTGMPKSSKNVRRSNVLKTKVSLYLMSCFASFAAVGCAPEKHIERTPIPTERIDCVVLQGEEGRPVLEDLYQIPWQVLAAAAREGGWTVEETLAIAQAEFGKYVTDRNKDDEEVAEYIFRLEDRVFHCANDAEWLRDREKKLDQEGH